MTALVWADEQSDLCVGCGLPRHDTMSPDAEGAYDARSLVCHACATKSRAVDAWQGDHHGLYWSVLR